MIREHAGGTRRLWLLKIPERGDVDRLLDARVPYPEIVRWLHEDCGHEDVTIHRLKAYIESPDRSAVAKDPVGKTADDRRKGFR